MSDDTKRYLKKFEVIETEAELPIQGQIKDPEDLYVFLKDLHSEQVPKVIGIYLDANNLFLGHQVFLGISASNFDTAHLYHYYLLFLAKKFILLINHPSGDATPTEDDLTLMRTLQMDANLLSFKPQFADYIVVGAKSYFSMATNDGTACKCGHQEYIGGL
jgi:DNA repair protein RadC